jgi:hypothetical protein
VDFNLANALTQVKVAMKEASDRAGVRRLQLYSEKIKCKPGCASCCARQIYITVAEALVLQEHLEKSGQWPYVQQRAFAKLCTAYEVRPAPCSTHFVTSDPSQCDPWVTKSTLYKSVEFKDMHDHFQKRLERCVDGHGILALKFPMPIALIFASRIKVQSGLGPNEIMTLIFNELQ